MKIFICTTFLIALAIGVKSDNKEDMEKHMMAIGQMCAKEHGITNDQLEAMMNNNLNGLTENQKCAAKCFLEKLEVIDGSGKVNEATVQHYIDDEPSMKDSLHECAKIDHSNVCEKSFQILGCVMAACHGK
uniref:CSON015349 protein n=1 Tax=Culicoides sonorensis TaxID=179676 RepID=A0A336MQF5_CULSO